MFVPVAALRPMIERERLSARPLLIASDFDGTLVPIRDRPEECRLDSKTADVMTELSRFPLVRVAVISGRDLADLQPRIGLSSIAYAGNHGLEISTPQASFRHPEAVQKRSILVPILEELTQQLARFPGVWVQDKELSASIHYRQADPMLIPQIQQLVRAEVARSVPGEFVLRQGKAVFEIRPAVNWHKGSAVKWLREKEFELSGAAAVLYLGDDETDEDVFRAFPESLTICVGEREATAARYQLPDVATVHQFLEQLLQSVSS